jgi:methylated-DNA-[protein]-cysteine S-methyltransferase
MNVLSAAPGGSVVGLRHRPAASGILMGNGVTTYYCSIPSPIGDLLLTAAGGGLSGVFMEDHQGGANVAPEWIEEPARFAQAKRQLDAYFAGTLREFDVALDMHGTDFQLDVWNALRNIPYGGTASYRDVAFAIRRPDALRAVGAANGRNPVSIIVPCHRVIGTDGSLTGYGGGLARKRFLLDLEAGYRRL